MSKRDVMVLEVRSAIGGFGGSPADIDGELAKAVMKESVKRSGVDPKSINYVTVGNCILTESRYPYVARVASIQAGLPMDSVAMAVNRLCSSGLQGIVTTAQNILLDDCDYGIGGGVEVMSRGAYLSTQLRSGARMGDSKMIDSMVAARSTLRCRPHGHHREPALAASAARSRTPWRSNRTGAPPRPSPKAASGRRSCRSSSRRGRAKSASTPTST